MVLVFELIWKIISFVEHLVKKIIKRYMKYKKVLFNIVKQIQF